jgi:protoheme IX farnesyltransferase
VACGASVVFAFLSTRVALRRSALNDAMKPEKQLFAFSILYLFGVFAALALDRLVLA